MKTFIMGNARFSVLSAGVIRAEYANGKAFCDSETLFAKRDSAEGDFFCEGKVSDTSLTVRTDILTLKYTGGAFSHDSLSVESPLIDGGVWHFGDRDCGNLGGTLTTLDGVDGFRSLPDGILSEDGISVVDDSGTTVIKNGWAALRDPANISDIYIFVYGRNYRGALRDLCAVSGGTQLPRKYFFGSWYSRWHGYSADEFLSIVDEYDEHGFPLDILVMDMDWHYHDWCYKEGDPRPDFGYAHAGGNMGWTGYTWNRRLIPDPAALIAELHRRGVAVTLNDHPCDGVRTHEECYPVFHSHIEKSGYAEKVPDVAEKISEREKENSPRDPGNLRFNAGDRDYMEAFFAATDSVMEDIGADFRWLDWQQDYIYPFVNGLPGLTHLKWLNRLYYEHSRKSGRRGMSFSRWGGMGDQKHPAYFSGDLISSWETLDFEIQMTVSAGNAGCFWWSHDIGGFYDPVPGGQSELYVRWVQFGALSPALRLHVCGDIDRRPWKWGEPFCSAMRKSFRLRSELMPYIYSSAYESYRDCVPLLRPLYLDMPECDEAYRHPSAYFFGPSLLAYPVHTPGVGERYTAASRVWLPKGRWYGWFDKKSYTAGFHTVMSDLEAFPLFVRSGVPVVTQPYSARMATAVPENLNVRIFCGFEKSEDGAENAEKLCGASVLYEDDGITEEYKDGRLRLTNIEYRRSSGGHTLKLTPSGGGYTGEREMRTWHIELCDCDALEKIEISGAAGVAAPLVYDADDRVARFAFEAAPSQTVEIGII